MLPGGVFTKTSRNESNAATNKVSSSSSVKETAENEDVISMLAHNMQMIQIQKLYFEKLQQQQQITADLTEENKKLHAENIALKDQTMSLSQKLMRIQFDRSKLESRIETLEERLRDKAKMLNFMFDENDNPRHAMHHRRASCVASGSFTS